jgi:ABC-type dipeptide/oligopeptide/nickel transport system permease subunit
VLSLVLAFGALAPLIANDLPVIASVDGVVSSPALVDCVGRAPAPPGGALSWKHWWASLPSGADDWAVMPLWPYGPFETLRSGVEPGPTAAHPFGLDDVGRDQLARLVHGARTAVLVAAGAVALAMLVGVLLGGFAGLGGRWCDVLVQRVIEVFTCFPALVAVIAAAAFFGGSRWTIVVVLATVQWTAFARVVRGELLSLRERPFVEVARGLGAGPLRLLAFHLLPALRGPVLITAAFLAAQAVLIEATLTFLGLGAGLGTVSWGAMLQQGKVHAWTGAWYLWAFPGLAIAATVLALHVLAEAPTAGGVRGRSPQAG